MIPKIGDAKLRVLTPELLKQIRSWREEIPRVGWCEIQRNLAAMGVKISRNNMIKTCQNHGRVGLSGRGWIYDAWCAPERGWGGPRKMKRRKKQLIQKRQVDKLPKGLPVRAPENAVIQPTNIPKPGVEPGDEVRPLTPIKRAEATPQIPPQVVPENAVEIIPSVSVGNRPNSTGEVPRTGGLSPVSKAPESVLPTPLVPECSPDELQERIRKIREDGEAARKKKREAQEEAQKLERERLEDAARMDQVGKDLVLEELRRMDPFYKPPTGANPADKSVTDKSGNSK